MPPEPEKQRSRVATPNDDYLRVAETRVAVF